MIKLSIFTDGGARGNPGPAAIGIVFFDKDKKIFEYKETIGNCTNNIAEYTALIKALELAKNYTTGKVFCHLDSELVVKQVNGEYSVKQDHLRELYDKLKEKEKQFESVNYEHLSRETKEIAMADALVNEALDEM